MIRKILFLIVVWSAVCIPMQPPQQFRMAKDDQNITVKKLKKHKKFSFGNGDCCDCFKWSEYLLSQYHVPEKRHPLMRRDEVPCCGECCEMVTNCSCSTVVFLLPQCCSSATCYMALSLAEQSYFPSLVDKKFLISLFASFSCSALVTMNNMRKEKEE